MHNENIHIQKYASKVLPHYINSINVYRFKKDVEVQLHPKGVFEIVFQCNDSFKHNTSYSSGWNTRPKSFIGGLHNKSYSIKSEADLNVCIAVEFKPNTAKYFIPEKLNLFQNNLVKVSDIWKDSHSKLLLKLEKQSSDLAKVRCIENFMTDKLINREESVVDKMIHIIHEKCGFVDIKQLAKSAQLSTSQFRKRFNEEIGISPSQYSKLIRVNTALNQLDRQKTSLTELTYRLGYFDQSHFIKDFKSVVGVSPKIIARNKISI